ncbi:Modulator of FtsH protease HflK [Oceanibacterium hippocampi]|uniref:Protein HflK n=2 Tax=Oceanibacterium hippocampi TaxID=745714 RepID=A0A1Y5TTT0_9PROT|nr:Modulator of FtsH protease HflK [Oceanibacterium hippocampi]
MLPGGAWGGRGIFLLILVVVLVWLGSGFYRVQPDEQGVVLRFGKWTNTTQPGLNYHLPYPVESVETPKVTRLNRIAIGFTGSDFDRGQNVRDVPAESLMITGDENIVDIDFNVLWVIKDAGEFLFNIDRPEHTVKAVAESVMREVIGRTPIQAALTEGRASIEAEVQTLMQQALDEYKSGVLITQVKLQKVDPPGAVIESFRDVQRARADRERMQNEAEAYRNDQIPRARGEAEKIEQGAEAYRQQVVSLATGEAARFTSIYNEYKKAPGVTARRIYLETMEEVLAGTNKIIIDSKSGGQGVLPYLPLPELKSKGGSN